MKLGKISTKQAERIIVGGKDLGFYKVKFAGIPLTIYHREYEGQIYDIAEMNTYMSEKDETVTTFYELDPNEVVQMLESDGDYFEKDSSKSI